MSDKYENAPLYQDAMRKLHESMMKRAKTAQAVMEGEKQERAKTPPEESE